MNLQSSAKLILGALCASAISAHAVQLADKVVLTEVSDTTLTADYYNGSTFLWTDTESASPDDLWSFHTSAAFLTTGLTGIKGWVEPDDSSEINLVRVESDNSGAQFLDIVVHSDFKTTDASNPLGNGASDVLDGVTVIFNDNGDGAVPDAASTGLLLSASTVALAAFKRVRRA